MKQEIVVQSGHYLNILDVAFDPETHMVATCSADESVRLWDITVGGEAMVLRGHTGPVYCVAFCPTGGKLASGGWDREIRLWDADSGTCLAVLAQAAERTVDMFTFSQDGEYLAVGDQGKVTVWEVQTAKCVQTIDGLNGVSMWALSDDGARLAASGGGRADAAWLRVFEVAGKKELFHLDPSENNAGLPVSAVLFQHNGPLLCASSRGVLAIDVTGNLPATKVTNAKDVSNLENVAGGRVAMYRKKTVEIWDLSVGKKTSSIAYPGGWLSPDTTMFARRDGRYLELIDARTGEAIRRLGTQLRITAQIGNLQRQFALASNPRYPILGTSQPDGLVRLWDLRLPAAPRVLHAHTAMIEAVAFDPRGLNVATCGTDGWVRLWRLADGALIHERKYNTEVRAITFTWDGTVLVVGHRQGVEVIDVASWRRRAKADCARIDAVAAAPTGEILAASNNVLTIWTNFPNKPTTYEHPVPIKALVVSPQGTLAVAGGNTKWFGAEDPKLIQGITALYEPQTGKWTHALTGHSSYVRAAAFSPDGATLVSAGGDGRLIAYDVASGETRFQVSAHAGEVTGVGFVSDGRLIASIGLDMATRLWDADSGEPAATLISLNEDDFVAATSDGYYAASKPGLRSVMLRMDGRLYPFEQFDLQLNRPDVVVERLGYAPEPVVEDFRRVVSQRLRRLGSDPSLGPPAAMPPKLRVTKSPPAIAHESRITLSLKLPEGANRLMVYINDVPIHGRRGLDVGGQPRLDLDTELAVGDNMIQAYTIGSGGAKSDSQTFRVFHPDSAVRRRLFVLAVGVSRYGIARYSLEYAAKDAADLAGEIKRRQKRFTEVKEIILQDGEATRRAIEQARVFLAQSGVDDQIIILLAGHGTIAGETYYYLPSDFDPADIPGTGLSYDQVEALVDGIGARRRLILLDTCHAGEIEEGHNAAPLPENVTQVRSFRDLQLPKAEVQHETGLSTVLRLTDIFADLRQESGAYVIAAAGAAEYAREFEELRNGVFTSAVIEALRSAHQDRPLIVSQLHAFVVDRVLKLTGQRQRPVSRRENLADDFAVI